MILICVYSLQLHFDCIPLAWFHDALWSSDHVRFCSIVLNSIKRLISHESLGPRLEALLFYTAVPTYTWFNSVCAAIFFLVGWPRTTRTAKLKSKMAKTSQKKLRCPSQPLARHILEMKHPSLQNIKHINKHIQQRTNPLHQLLACFASLRSRPPLAKDSAPACSSCTIHIRFYRNAKA